MIAAYFRGGTLVFESGRTTVVGTTHEIEARVQARFAKSALGRESTEIEFGGIGEDRPKLAPGSAAHARAVIFGLPEAHIVLDDEAG